MPISSSTTIAPAPPEIPLRDFFRNPEATLYALSPNGEMIAFLKPDQDRLNIWLRTRQGGDEPRRLTSVTDRDIAYFFWKGDRHLVFLKDTGGDENFHLFAVPIDGSPVRELTPFEGVKAEIVDELEDRPAEMIIALNKRNREVFDAYRLNIENGELKLVAENPGHVVAWLADHAGEVRVATTTDGVTTSLLYRETLRGPWRTVLTTDFRESFTPQFFTFDNKALYGLSNIGRDKAAAVEFDLDNGKETKVLWQNQEVDLSGLTYSRHRKVLTAAVYVTWKTERKFYDRFFEEMDQSLQQKLPGSEVLITSSNREETLFIVRTFSDRSQGAFYLFEARTGQLTKLADRAPWLSEDQLSSVNPIEYQARDGLTLHGYLTLPRGRIEKNLPLVVNPHGGPWFRDIWGFNPEVQFLANRGYAVLQVNFRSSTGYGRRFWEAGFKQWGGSMQDDLTDGVKWLVAQGIADPERIAIYGGSYGGYAVLQGLVKEPDLYAAGVDYVGVSNLFSFLQTIPPYWKPYLEMMYAMVGHPELDRTWFEAHSPALNAEKIRTPLFVAQGAKDPRVNVEESNQIVEALKKRGVEVEYLLKADEGHGFRNEENRFEFYEAMERFLQAHLQPGN